MFLLEKYWRYIAFVFIWQSMYRSICYLLDETDPESNVSPLFEMQLSLEEPHVLFHPAVDPDDPTGFYAFYEGLLLDIMRMGTLIPRVDPDVAAEREHYEVRPCIRGPRWQAHYYLALLPISIYESFPTACKMINY
ncbi:dynein beta chain, ciliary-like [Ooceraea biroi]|uniref:dynein beta chain, ciliary-like n=1 Tax=Ooceraea biroi TaxID=2015173 RepID=UPI000F08846C|nr:dynein beta chain, ciliary-like [Ooceraea biroi]